MINEHTALQICSDQLGWTPLETARLHGTSHIVFVFHNKDRHVVLRFPKKQNANWIGEQLAIKTWLRNHQVLVPMTFATGRDTGESEIPWMLVEYGGVPLNRVDITDDQRRDLDWQAGEILANMHAKNADENSGIIDLCTGKFEISDLQAKRSALSEKALEWFVEKDRVGGADRARIYELLSRIERTNSYTICHGDYTPDNLLVSGGRIRFIVDWERTLSVTDPLQDLIRWEMVRRLWGGDFDSPTQGYFQISADEPRYRAQRIPLLIQQLLIRLHVGQKFHYQETNRRFRELLWFLLNETGTG